MAYPVVLLNQSSKLSLKYMYISWVNLNFKLAISQSRTEVHLWINWYCLFSLLAENINISMFMCISLRCK